MSIKKVKLSDLAEELGFSSSKDLIQRFTEIDVIFKPTARVVDFDVAEKFKAYHAQNPKGKAEQQNTMQSDVRVRRHRKVEPVPDVAANDISAEQAIEVKSDASNALLEEASGVEQKNASTTVPDSKEDNLLDNDASTIALKEDEEKEISKNKKTSKKSSIKADTPPARVISMPKDEKEAEKIEQVVVADSANIDAVKNILPDSVEASDVAKSEESVQDMDKVQATKTSRLVTPMASALPDGSSVPTLRPTSDDVAKKDASPSEAGETDAAGRKDESSRRRRKRPMDIPSPQVRIISRPDVSQQVAKPATPAVAGADRKPRYPRSQGAGANQTTAPRPQAARPDGARPPYNRPAGAPVSHAPAKDAPGAENRDQQSKKKRNKGRRTVDFQAGSNEFGRKSSPDGMPRMNRSRGKRKSKDHRNQTTVTQPLKAAKRKVRISETIRLSDMAHQMGLKAKELIKVLFDMGVMANINQSLDFDTATLVASEFKYEVEKAGFSEEDYVVPTVDDLPEHLKTRPPVVTIMGHVDHGKTSLLDAIRKSNVTKGEAGGITQHIGAYHVKTERGEIVFLDTPGHEAFTAMRLRGAQITDLVVLVVAADDGVMEQTKEAINHAKAADVPVMVAVNKMDKPGAEPDRVLRELSELGLQAEDWGGDVVVSKVSAITGEGLDELLELIVVQAEMMELKANPDKPARGHVVEAKMDKGRGPVATVLIKEGTLVQGSSFVCGVFSGKVKAIFNDQGKKIKSAGPSIPVEVHGFDGVPEAGDEFVCVADEKLARRIADARAIKLRARELSKDSKVTLETFLASSIDDEEALTLNLVIKTDVKGSLGAITESLLKQSTDKVRINIVHGGTGAITESDILLSSASNAIIIGFNVKPTAKIKEMADSEHIDIRFYDIIYKLSEEIKSAMTGMLAPIQREVYLGQAEVRETFSVPKIGLIAGCHVTDGKLNRNAGIRLLREGVVIYTGKINSLRRFKDDAKEVLKGYECGIGLENYNDLKVGDIIEGFEMIEEAATL